MIRCLFITLLSIICLTTTRGQSTRGTICEVFNYTVEGPESRDNPIAEIRKLWPCFVDDVCSRHDVPGLREILTRVSFHNTDSEFPNDVDALIQQWNQHNRIMEMLGVTLFTLEVPHKMDSTIFVGELLYPDDYKGFKRREVRIPGLELKSSNYQRFVETHFLLILYLLAMELQHDDGKDAVALAKDRPLIVALLSEAYFRIPTDDKEADKSMQDLYSLVRDAAKKEEPTHENQR